MTMQHFRSAVEGVLAVLFACNVIGFVSLAHAEITSSGLNTTVTSSNGVYDITGGTRPGNGNNLFHSFGEFSLGSSEIGNFVNDTGLPTNNIVGRVTGGNPSNIFGTIQTTGFPGANLYLMNPAGILFGPTAQLNVEGSFHATTADYIKLGSDGIFYANAAQSSTLTASPPSAFGFLTSNPASIDVQAGTFDFNTSQFAPLMVPEGETLSLVGGTINLGTAEVRNDAGEVVEDAQPTSVLAPGGRINLVSVASPGEVLYDGTMFNADTVEQLGDINIVGGDIFGGALMFPTLIDAKEVFIRGGQLLVDNALITPGFFFLFDLGPLPDGGEVNVQVTGDATMTGSDVDPFIGNAPGIVTYAGAFFAPPELFPDAKVPDITIDASSLTISDVAAVQTARFGAGEPAELTVNADTVTVENGGSISAINFYDGPGGNVIVNAREVNLSGDGTPSPTGATGINAITLFHPCYGCANFDPRLTSGDGGSITVNATDSVNISGDAAILTDSPGFGDGGDITINTNDMSLTGAGEFSGAISAQTALVGSSGDITINATGQIQINDGFRITATTAGNSDGGIIDVAAGQSITLTGSDSRIISTTAQLSDDSLNALFLELFQVDFDTLAEETGVPDADIFNVLAYLNSIGMTNVTDLTPGNAGTVNISSPLLTMNADTRIAVSTGWDGNAGDIVGNVGSLFVKDGASIRSQSGIQPSDAAAVIGVGNAGVIALNAKDTITISGKSPTTGEKSTVSTSTFGDGNGGSINLTADQIVVGSGGSITAETGGILGSEFYSGTGNAGDISITTAGPTNTITVSGVDSTISTATFGDGAGGSIELTSDGNVQIRNGGSVASDSAGTGFAGDISIAAGNKIDMNDGTISTRAVTADGGNITLTAPELVYLLNSDITTSVESGFGGGGNITIDPQFVILNQSNILANAFGGPGGNITIVADNVISSAQSSIDASSALGINGTVNISSPDQDVAQELAVLPENFLDVTGLISDRCGTAAGSSSLVSAGPGGLAVDPDGYLPSFGTMTNAGYNGNGENSAINSGKPWWALAVDTSALQLAQVTCTR